MSWRVVVSPNRSGSVWPSHPLAESRIAPAMAVELVGR